MESAHITQTAPGVDSVSIESMAVRVHSRLTPRPLDPQGLYQQALSVQGAVQSESQPQGSELTGSELTEPELEADQETADQQTPIAQVPDAQSGEAENYETAQCETTACESFDASPVEQTEGEVIASPKSGTGHSGIVDSGDSVSKKDLVALLEGFVRIIKTEDVETGSGLTTATGTGIELSRERGLVTSEARIDDRTVEIDQLRGLVIEAQDTIIKLLTDRVDDRSRIATLEAQLNLLPDLQAQADRAMSVAVRTDEYRTELTKMKFELDRFRLFRVRIEAEQKKGSVFNRIQKWLFSRPNAKAESLQRNSYQKMVDQSHTEPVGSTKV